MVKLVTMESEDKGQQWTMKSGGVYVNSLTKGCLIGRYSPGSPLGVRRDLMTTISCDRCSPQYWTMTSNSFKNNYNVIKSNIKFDKIQNLLKNSLRFLNF